MLAACGESITLTADQHTLQHVINMEITANLTVGGENNKAGTKVLGHEYSHILFEE